MTKEVVVCNKPIHHLSEVIECICELNIYASCLSLVNHDIVKDVCFELFGPMELTENCSLYRSLVISVATTPIYTFLNLR